MAEEEPDHDLEGWRERLGSFDEPSLYALPEFPRYRNPHDDRSQFDRLGRKQFHVMGVEHYLLYLEGAGERARHVPDRAVEYAEDDDGRCALIECPCGRKPIVRAALEQCAGCERHYMLAGKRAVVIYGDMALPANPGLNPSDEATIVSP